MNTSRFRSARSASGFGLAIAALLALLALLPGIGETHRTATPVTAAAAQRADFPPCC
ncbi:hypothetical protein ACFV23_07130 [Streptomyces sp. NPDC059627]